MTGQARATIVIPAFDPTPTLVDLIVELAPERDIIVVDDGSPPAAQSIFARVATERGVVLLRHAVNLGKGQALKTAFNHFLLHASPDAVGVVTADADGQHLPEDIRRVAGRLEQAPDALVLGSRAFEGCVPIRNRLGNAVTRRVFRLLLGRSLPDTQTGLRGIPQSFLPELLAIEAARYEFELEVLVLAARRRLPIATLPIRTVYSPAAHTHFNALRDSVRIYFVFVRFISLSLATAVLDYGVFVAMYFPTHQVLGSIAVARSVAGIFNFVCSRWFVFRSRGDVRREAVKYVLVVFALMWISYALVMGLVIMAGIGVYVAKLLADGTLFVASFALQHALVFRPGEAGAAASTDWDAYYQRPAWFARATRRITAHKLLAIVGRFAPAGSVRHVVELGGGNSTVIRGFADRYPQAHFTAVDTNALGLQLLAHAFTGDVRVTTVQRDVLTPAASLEADVVFSTGLIEHFDPAGTARAVAAHFEQVRPGGLVVITYPTPTWLYRLVRSGAAGLGLWAFPDERPLTHEEVSREVARHGSVLDRSITWAIILTQGVLVARRNLQS